MTQRIVETVVGCSLIAAAIYMLMDGQEQSEWLMLAIVGCGAHFVSKSLVMELVASAVKLLGAWRNRD